MNAPAISSNHLNIGDMVLGRAPHTISTLLGSCVAICMYEPSRQIGAMCHCALPKCRSSHQCRPGCGQAGKHVECAIRVMLHHFQKQQIPREDIQVKLFGGANVLSSMGLKTNSWMIGSQNEETARRIITRNRLTIRAADTGGERGRKILFDINTGKVSVAKIKKTPLLHQKASITNANAALFHMKK
jgi:chemotaxis protein CheD